LGGQQNSEANGDLEGAWGIIKETMGAEERRK
jgi:hypothetical protein